MMNTKEEEKEENSNQFVRVVYLKKRENLL